MKRLVLLLFMCPFLQGLAQDEKVFEKYTAEKRYTIDGGSVVVSKIVENIEGSKEDIYTRAKSYLARAYNDSKSVIQTDDKESGIIIGKGLYTRLASFNLGAWTMKAYHILRVDIKEGRARIICSASTVIPNSSAHLDNEYEYSIINYYPITDKHAPSLLKKPQLRAFISLIDEMNKSVLSLEKALKEGGVLDSEKEDW